MKRKQILLIHIAAWGLLLAGDLWPEYAGNYMFRGQPKNLHLFLNYFIIQAGYLTIPISCFYSSYFFVAPQLFVSKKYILALVYSILILAGIVCLRYLLEYQFFLPVLGFDNYRGHPWPVSDYIENIFFYYFPKYFVYGLMYFFAESWYKSQQQRQELLKEKANAELVFLRSQINPHFLFNSINDIYSLIYQKSEQAPAALLKLSDILRYMLREGKADMVPIQNEVEHIENVIELQRISAKGNVFINFTIEGYLGGQKMASLLFIAFVENAFKHGVLTDGAHPVQISLQLTQDQLQFTVANKKNHDQKDQTPGIGLNNVRRRLALMYPGKHKLAIDDEAEYYTVNLELQLT